MLQKSMTLIFVLFVSVQTAAAEDMSFKLTKFDKELIKQTNQQRAAYNLPPLKMDKQVMLSARKHCYWMAMYGSFQHTSDPIAENIAWNQADVTAVIQAWMNSSGHRANILNPNYTVIGVSCYQATDGSLYWCQQFSSR